MNILVLGATGRVGSQIVELALQAKHHVTVLVRSTEKIQHSGANLTIVQGNVLNKADIEDVMVGKDAVISALNSDGAATISESMQLIVEAMNNEGLKRIITVGTAGILQSKVNPDILRYQSSESKRKSTLAAEDHHKAYDILNKSELAWTIICPTYLPDGPRLGKYRVERHFLPDNGSVISVSDTAEFAFNQITSSEYIKSRVGIAY
ncbi:NAD(P)-dependent oxidoreductase [Cohnella abietis]|uniref:Oxidoreductase n=1 Tax=Cohnella abietis TaxID=2507935 RepID=A0A3T1D5R5_9BACL|nr:SDR family oxidoreductase [Cohnella abietis]BBI33295.1 oxidoreductase [Cohnella abietis]